MVTQPPSSNVVKHRDVTGVVVQFSEQAIFSLLQSMDPAQRGQARLIAQTIKTPSEIWQQWVRDPQNPNGWVNRRTYLLTTRTVEQELTGEALGIAVEFTFAKCWSISGVHLLQGLLVNVSSNLNKAFRGGELKYSTNIT